MAEIILPIPQDPGVEKTLRDVIPNFQRHPGNRIAVHGFFTKDRVFHTLSGALIVMVSELDELDYKGALLSAEMAENFQTIFMDYWSLFPRVALHINEGLVAILKEEAGQQEISITRKSIITK